MIENPFNLNSKTELFTIVESLKESIQSIEPFYYNVSSLNYSTSEIFINTNSKILYILFDFDLFNNEGTSKIFIIERLLSTSWYRVYSASVNNGSHIASSHLNRSLKIYNRVTIGSTMLNSISFFTAYGFKITLI